MKEKVKELKNHIEKDSTLDIKFRDICFILSKLYFLRDEIKKEQNK